LPGAGIRSEGPDGADAGVRVEEREEIALPSLGHSGAIVHEYDVRILPQLESLVDARAPAPLFPVAQNRDVARVNLVEIDRFVGGGVVDDEDVEGALRMAIDPFDQVPCAGELIANGDDDVCRGFR